MAAAKLDASIATELVRQGGWTRRSFLQAASAGALGLAVSGLLGACSEEDRERIANRPVRKDLATLTPTSPEVTKYRDAVAAMKALPSSDARSWTRQAEIHVNFCPHRNWLFLPWHRAYLWYFEEICRELINDDGFALPYWNWTASPQVPAAFWNESDALFNNTRGIDSSSTVNASIFGQPAIDLILAETNFLNFASGSIPLAASQRLKVSQGPLESGPHNGAHNFVSGDMASLMSPLDPIFWMHHNRIDQLWADWNIRLNRPNTNDPEWTNREFTEFVDRTGAPVTIGWLSLLLMPYFSYRFDTQGS